MLCTSLCVSQHVLSVRAAVCVHVPSVFVCVLILFCTSVNTRLAAHKSVQSVHVCDMLLVCVTGAVGALYGPLHGGANEAVLRMLERIGKVENIPKFVEGVKNRKEKMFGFGHRYTQACLCFSLRLACQMAVTCPFTCPVIPHAQI